MARYFDGRYSSDRRSVEGDLIAIAEKDESRQAAVVSVLNARASLGRLLERVDAERRSLVIEKRGAPRAVLLSIRDYVKLAAPEPEVLKLLGEDSERKRTNSLTDGQINSVIKAARAKKKS